MCEPRAPMPAAAPTRSFDDDRTLLLGVFTDVVQRAEGPEALRLHERAVALARAARGGEDGAAGELERLVASLDVERAEVLVRSLTRFFQLINLAEDNERIRRLRHRDAEHGPMHNSGSIRDAIRRLAEDSATAEELTNTLAAAEVRLVMTAHPTEARRRTT